MRNPWPRERPDGTTASKGNPHREERPERRPLVSGLRATAVSDGRKLRGSGGSVMVGGDIPTLQGPALLCFDGSSDSQAAIAQSGVLLAGRSAVIVTVWEPVKTWAPYDPATLISAPLARIASEELGLDDITAEAAHETVERGVKLALGAGLDARGRVVNGKTWRAICDLGNELDAALIVLGARGLSRVQSALLGSVSASVSVHAGRPVLVVPRTAASTTRRVQQAT